MEGVRGDEMSEETGKERVEMEGVRRHGRSEWRWEE